MVHATTAPASSSTSASTHTPAPDFVDVDPDDAFLLEDRRQTAEDIEGGERQPLLSGSAPVRSSSDRTPNQQQFRAAQNEAVQQVVYQGGWFSFLLFLFAFSIF